MNEENKFEKQELSREIVTEWYQEKGLSNEQEEDLPSPSFSSSEKTLEQKKDKEEEKKLLVKRDVKQLLAIAEKKGLEESIKEARKKNNPFLLDVYHDVLAKDAAYKNFLRK